MDEGQEFPRRIFITVIDMILLSIALLGFLLLCIYMMLKNVVDPQRRPPPMEVFDG